MSDSSHRPAATKHEDVCRLHFAPPSFVGLILFLLLGLTGQTTALHLPSSKPQAAAYAMKFEGLRAETELVEQGSQISRGPCDTFNWGRHGNFSLSLVIMHIKP